MTADLIYGNSIRPKTFADGLQYWRSDLINRSSAKLSTSPDVNRIDLPNDDFGKIQFTKSGATQQIVHHTKTPQKTGQYLEIKFRVKLISGAAPNARIICAPVKGTSTIISGVPTHGPQTEIRMGSTYEISAIVGSGNRNGVDMAWGLDFNAMYAGI